VQTLGLTGYVSTANGIFQSVSGKAAKRRQYDLYGKLRQRRPARYGVAINRNDR
jgi:hypothetical protein